MRPATADVRDTVLRVAGSHGLRVMRGAHPHPR